MVLSQVDRKWDWITSNSIGIRQGLDKDRVGFVEKMNEDMNKRMRG